MNSLSWDLMRTFLQVARSGSLSAAAKVLGVSQPTLSRNIQLLESNTQLQLFRRSTQGLELTEAGERLMDAAHKMDDAADLFQRQVSGFSQELKGDIRISATEVVGTYLLPAALVAFKKQHPGVHMEIDITNQTTSLSKRDVDIALRMYRPSQADLVARRLPDIEMGIYATQEYIDAYGMPDNPEELKHHQLIGFDKNMQLIEGARQLGMEFSTHDFTWRTDKILAQIQLGRAGAGIVHTYVGLAQHWPELKRVMQWVSVPSLQFWVVCHSDTQYNTRIRALTAFLSEWFAGDPYAHVVL